MRWISPAVVLLLALASGLRAEPAAGVEELSGLFGKGKPRPGTFGVAVLEAKSGRELFAVDALTPRIPASTMKIVTTAASFVALGPEHEIETRVVALARPDATGRLGGDLIVVGGGDPTIDATAEGTGGIDRLAGGVARAGVRSVAGDLVLDDTLFDRQLRHPSWEKGDYGKPWCAAVTPLTVNRGCLSIRVRPGAVPGSPAEVTVIPITPLFRLANGLVTTSHRKEHRIALTLLPDGKTVSARGKVWTKAGEFRGEIPVPDPTLLFGEALRIRLIAHGVSVAGKVVRRPGAGAGETVEIARISTKLLEVLTTTNKESQNLFADCLFKDLGFRAEGRGSFEAAGRATAALARSLRFPPGHLKQVDGSGLSRENRVTPYFLAKLLALLFARKDWKAYARTLPHGGESGTSLKKRMADLGTDVLGKTGTIRHVTALTGYVRARSGRVLTYAILINDPSLPLSSGRKMQDQLCRVLRRSF